MKIHVQFNIVTAPKDTSPHLRALVQRRLDQRASDPHPHSESFHSQSGLARSLYAAMHIIPMRTLIPHYLFCSVNTIGRPRGQLHITPNLSGTTDLEFCGQLVGGGGLEIIFAKIGHVVSSRGPEIFWKGTINRDEEV